MKFIRKSWPVSWASQSILSSGSANNFLGKVDRDHYSGSRIKQRLSKVYIRACTAMKTKKPITQKRNGNKVITKPLAVVSDLRKKGSLPPFMSQPLCTVTGPAASAHVKTPEKMPPQPQLSGISIFPGSFALDPS